MITNRKITITPADSRDRYAIHRFIEINNFEVKNAATNAGISINGIIAFVSSDSLDILNYSSIFE